MSPPPFCVAPERAKPFRSYAELSCVADRRSRANEGLSRCLDVTRFAFPALSEFCYIKGERPRGYPSLIPRIRESPWSSSVSKHGRTGWAAFLTWEVAAWHREHYYLRFIRTNGKEEYRDRGRFSVTVKPRQTTDTGVVTVLTELPPLVRQVEDVVSELGGKIWELEARIDELERQLAEAKKESAASREKPSNNVKSPEPKQ